MFAIMYLLVKLARRSTLCYKTSQQQGCVCRYGSPALGPRRAYYADFNSKLSQVQRKNAWSNPVHTTELSEEQLVGSSHVEKRFAQPNLTLLQSWPLEPTSLTRKAFYATIAMVRFAS